jgi:hypothetical protein
MGNMTTKIRLMIGASLVSILTLAYISHVPSQPSFNGSATGCAGSGCHSFQAGLVTATAIDNLTVEVTVGSTSGNVAGELVDETGTIVAVVEKTSANPFTLTAPGPGLYTVNAGMKDPQRRWDSTRVSLGTAGSASDDARNRPSEAFRLNQNYPNPFNPSTIISFVTPRGGDVQVSVYNCLGQRVASVFEGWLEGGYHEVTFQNPGLPSGAYFYRLDMGTSSLSRRLQILK